MKKTMRIILFLILILVATGCSKGDFPNWQAQYDLGINYLADGNYEEAIIAFMAAIEIDPKQPAAYVGRAEAYIGSGETGETLAAAMADYEAALALDEANLEAWLGLADVYIRQGEYDKAKETLQKALEKTGENVLLAEKLKELESGKFIDSAGNVRRTMQYGENGEVVHIRDYQYDARGYKTYWKSMDYENGRLLETSYAVVEFGEDGYPYKNTYYHEDGTPTGVYDLMVFNELGQEVERRKLNTEFEGMSSRYVYYYDEVGRRIRYDHYSNGELRNYWEVQYDESGNQIGATGYDAEGNVTGYETYE